MAIFSNIERIAGYCARLRRSKENFTWICAATEPHGGRAGCCHHPSPVAVSPDVAQPRKFRLSQKGVKSA
ncbi:hypothetical protein NDU88_000329 [Pleurodeles waltl]|uniref:Uncharacterized protein n=1 Tax=Pleurodeles waltl TaxID=8319 RepID=A0AAV7LUB3_PLEWA|nr:hypothetical protein NDU88_000329 [Pleurodeles waltl]